MTYPQISRAKCNALALEALRWVGVRETSRNAGWAVEKFQQTVDGKATGEAWCMAFVQFCVNYIDTLGGAMGLGLETKARLHASEHCLTVWNKTPVEQRLAKPHEGCIVIWQHVDANNVGTLQGHAGIVIAVARSGFQTVEGNTGSDSGREGDGVYLKTRSHSGHGSLRVKGFLAPW